MAELPTRKRIRLTNYDYSQNGAYFVTICTAGKQHLFGAVTGGIMQYSSEGLIAREKIREIANHRTDVEVCNAVVMPNHVHLLLQFRRGMTCHAHPVREFGKPVSGSLGIVIGAYKASVTKEIREEMDSGMTSHAPTQKMVVWQRGYHDHIIRNQADFDRIWKYIDENPLKWELDRYYCKPEQEETYVQTIK